MRRTFDLVRQDRKRVSAFAIIALLLGAPYLPAQILRITLW